MDTGRGRREAMQLSLVRLDNVDQMIIIRKHSFRRGEGKFGLDSDDSRGSYGGHCEHSNGL
jgi:hypothetical protein